VTQRILFLDANPGEGALLRHHLDRIPGFRYRFEQAATAAEALRRAPDLAPHVVFVSDVQEDDCPEAVIRRLRECLAARPIVVLGSSRDADLAVRLIHAGADEYVRKGPIDPVRLREVIERAESRSIRRHVERDLQDRASRLSGMLEKESLAMRELEVAMERVEAASREKSSFLANVSHEIRTPLTAILGYADELARDEVPADERREAARIIRRNGDFLLRILDDLLDLSRIEAGALETECVPFSPLELLHDVESTFAAAAREAGIALRTGVDGPIPETIQSDPTRVRQVLVNLVGNALKFTGEGEVDARMSVREDEGDGPQLEFRVRDTGIGMTPEEIARIFRPFTQADSSTTRRFGGTGLGLTISERLVRQLGGRIDVTSEPERGSVFTFSVAAGDLTGVPRLDEAQARTRRSGVTKAESASLPPCHLLLADDNSVNLRLVSRILERMGARITTATTGVEAIEAVLAAEKRDDPVDLVLMDLQMPELDGIGAVNRLRGDGWDGPIVALTGNALEDDRRRCLASGFDGFSTKPIRRRELGTLIRSLLGTRHRGPDPTPGPRVERPS